jgi:hypothetical protein
MSKRGLVSYYERPTLIEDAPPQPKEAEHTELQKFVICSQRCVFMGRHVHHRKCPRRLHKVN